MSGVRAEAVDTTVQRFSLDQLACTGYGGLTPRELRTWLLTLGLARPNGSPDTLELTERGAEVAAGVRELQAWIRA